VLGTLAPLPFALSFPRVPEDNGSIPLAGNIGITANQVRTTNGRIGDGPHGSAGDGHGDFDFYRLAGARKGQRLLVDIDTPNSSLDSLVSLWDANGALLAIADGDDVGFDDARLTFAIPQAGNYFIAVGGFFSLPANPFDPASGGGFGSEGGYQVRFGLNATDVDIFSVDLRPGDVVAASVAGAATELTLTGPGGVKRVGSAQDASFLYPGASPLPGGGNAVLAYVVDTQGRHTLRLDGVSGNYDVTLEVYRPGPESIGSAVPTIFLDFDGARVNTGIFGGPGVRQLSPLSSFLGRWGIPATSQNALIHRVVSVVTENLKDDFGTNGVAVRILNSRDDPDPFGQPNVSRIIVGGTISESGIPTIGIAQTIDPGNFERSETALVLLDILSDATDPFASLNAYFGPGTNKVRFVGTALANVIAHEAGHIVGSFHTDEQNGVANLMDAGGNFPQLFGVGPDGVGGTADDPDVDYGNDVLRPFEGFTGVENTHANTKWGLSPNR
jgi:hypothetical protein